jgi:predicted NBD/HSP70 family sugar kinase
LKTTPDFARDPRQMRGSNHSGMRQFNERIVLQAIRRHGAIAKADLARLTQLSTQTVSIIVDRLIDDGLVLKKARVRGKVGQPSVPLSLNSDGAFSIGLQVGRRSLEVVAVDFVGAQRHRLQFQYAFPDPMVVTNHIEVGLEQMRSAMGANMARTVGIGLTAPLSMDQWAGLLGRPAGATLSGWKEIDLLASVQALTDLPVQFAKDTTAACMAEMLQGRGLQIDNFIYIFVGTFVGGGLVLAGHIMAGPRGNAGAIGSMPTGIGAPGRAPSQVLELASGWQLEQSLLAHGLDPQLAHNASIMDWRHDALTKAWLREASQALAMTIVSATALVDLDAAVIDGSLDPALIRALITATHGELANYKHEGLHAPTVMQGLAGAHARALGGALLPLHASFFPLKDIFLKQDLT